MKHYVQFDSCGKSIDEFFLPDGSDDQRMVIGIKNRLYDYSGAYVDLKVGESVRFTGTTTIKRIA